MSNEPKTRQSIIQLNAYIPGKSKAQAAKEYGVEKWIKLASNENPFGSPITAEDLAPICKDAAMYPDQAAYSLKNDIDGEIVLGNGSDDVIQMIALAYLNEGDEVITAESTFSVYTHVTQLMGATLTTVPLKDYKYDINGLLDAVTDNTKVIFIANPNNPTGTVVDIEELLKACPSHVLVAVDEAYIEFASIPSATTLINSYPNLVVLRTFSKCYGLAGFRIGYGVGQAAIIENLRKVRQPFNVNNFALAAASKALKDTAFIEKTLTNNTEQRERLVYELQSLPVTICPSEANFLCLILEKDASDCIEFLIKKGIIIRHLASFGLPNAIRISIGLPDENTQVINALKEYFNG